MSGILSRPMFDVIARKPSNSALLPQRGSPALCVDAVAGARPLRSCSKSCEIGNAATESRGTDAERAWAGPSGHPTIRVSDGTLRRETPRPRSQRPAIRAMLRVVKASDIITIAAIEHDIRPPDCELGRQRNSCAFGARRIAAGCRAPPACSIRGHARVNDDAKYCRGTVGLARTANN
jgi:hypothetical protein